MDNKVRIESVINLFYKTFMCIIWYKILIALQSLVQLGLAVHNQTNSIFK